MPGILPYLELFKQQTANSYEKLYPYRLSIHTNSLIIYDMTTTPTTDVKSQLWIAVEKLMLIHYGKINISRLSRDADIGLGTVARLQNADLGVGLDKVQKIAQAFGLEAHQLLDPNFAPADRGEPLSEKSIFLGRQLDKIKNPVAATQAYAMCLQAVELASKTPL